jgi:hypothetical protein
VLQVLGTERDFQSIKHETKEKMPAIPLKRKIPK